MRFRHSLMACFAAVLVLAGCSSHNQPPSQAPAASTPALAGPASSAPPPGTGQALRATIERFGKHMQDISVLAPPDAVRGELPKAYGDSLAPALLKAWQENPAQAIGREGSSPWPEQIEISKIDCTTPGACRVTGDVDYITSNELAHGGVFMRRPITLDATRNGTEWRIVAVKLGPARH